jgi:hypothetical protein
MALMVRPFCWALAPYHHRERHAALRGSATADRFIRA